MLLFTQSQLVPGPHVHREGFLISVIRPKNTSTAFLVYSVYFVISIFQS